MAKKTSSKPTGDAAHAASPSIRFSATLKKPKPTDGAKSDRNGWSFLVLPQAASAKLPSRGMVSVRGTFGSAPLHTTLQPDGGGGHWLKIERKLREAAGIEIGDTVTLEIAPVAPGDEPEPDVPPDLRRALADAPGPDGAEARASWKDMTPAARRDWIQWITSGKRAETRVLRIEKACDMLASGKRRPCCFDRSGMYDKSLSCPIADRD